MREMERRGNRGSGLLPCPLPSPGSTPAGHAGKRPSSRRGTSRCGAGAPLPITAQPEQARWQLWAAPGWLLGSSSWGAF